MKTSTLSVLLASLLAGSVLVGNASATVYQTLDKTYSTETAPLAITASLDGKHTFVLGEGGKVTIFNDTGDTDTLVVDPTMDSISTSPRGDILYLSSKSTRKVVKIFVDFKHDIDLTGSPFLGNGDAPVVIVAFTDFQCSHCAKLGEVFAQLLTRYPDTIKIVHKDFPLENHPYAADAALAAAAAQQQGKFWQYHDMLFADFRNLSKEKFTEFAQKLTLNMPLFTQTMKSDEAKKKVINDMIIARDIGVASTPSIFVNGRLLRDHTFEGLEKLIKPLLQKN